MPGFVQHLASTGYGYIDNHLERARNMVPLFDATVQRIEPYIQPTLLTADKYVGVVYNTAEVHVIALHGKQVALKGKVSNLRDSASSRFHSAGAGIHTMVVGFVDRSDALVDRVLPPDEAEKKAIQEHIKANRGASSLALLPRTLYIPCKIPVRMSKIVFVKAAGLAEGVSNGIATFSAPGVLALRSSKDAASRKMGIAWQCVVDGKQAVVVWLGGQSYLVVSRLHLPQLKDWTLEKIHGLKQGSAVILTRIGVKKAAEPEKVAYKAVAARSVARKSS